MQQSRPDSLLLLENILAEAEAWATAHTDQLTGTELDVLESSRRASFIVVPERCIERLIRTLAIVSIFTIIILLVTLYWRLAGR